MKKFLITMSAVALFALGTQAFADMKIGVLDLNKVMMDSPQLEVAKKTLKGKFDVREKEILAAQKTFQSDIEKFSKDSPTMDEKKKTAEQQRIVGQQKDLQEKQAKFQKDLNDAQNEAMKGIVKNIEGIVNDLATSKKFDLIIAKAGTAYNKPELEVTDEVIKQMKMKK
jgi:outer membrane protein